MNQNMNITTNRNFELILKQTFYPSDNIFQRLNGNGYRLYNIAMELGYSKSFNELIVINECITHSNIIKVPVYIAKNSEHFKTTEKILVFVNDINILLRLIRFTLVQRNVLYIGIYNEDIIKLWELEGFQKEWYISISNEQFNKNIKHINELLYYTTPELFK